jgi:hypothetical protein
MKFKKYIKETYETDKKYRNESEKAYTKLMNYIRKKATPYDLIEYKPEKGAVIFGKEIGYKKLIFIVNPGTRGTAGFTNTGIKLNGKQYKVIMLYGLKNVFSELDKKTLEGTYIDKGTFVHEFIHYLDSERGNYMGSAKALKKGDAEYYNTASEFNAFFQEISSFVENIIQTAARVNSTKTLDKWLKTFHDFDKTIKQVLKQDATLQGYITLLNKKYSKKYVKRLYNLYDAMINKYYNIIK